MAIPELNGCYEKTLIQEYPRNNGAVTRIGERRN
jgi:hypothetical protein